MKLVLGIPVVNQVELTTECIESIIGTVSSPTGLFCVTIDNGSTPAYQGNLVLRNEINRGYYYPLKQLYDTFPNTDLIALCHNDLLFYEHGWDERLKDCFERDPQLGLVGFAGSSQVDAAGGRGTGTMMNFRGERGQTQAGYRISGIEPAVSLDSLFMCFRREVIPSLLIDDDIALCHFYDRIWTLRTIEAGWHVGVLGIEIDHQGGQTSTGGDYNATAIQWCEAHGIPVENGNGDLAMYLEAERRYLTEYRDEKHLIPCSINSNYDITSC